MKLFFILMLSSLMIACASPGTQKNEGEDIVDKHYQHKGDKSNTAQQYRQREDQELRKIRLAMESSKIVMALTWERLQAMRY